MTPDRPDFCLQTNQPQINQHFVQEATDLLALMRDELQTLRSDFSPQKVHTLMRAAHTLKGASASVGLEGINKISHSLEDVFRALCYPDVALSVEVEGLILEGYNCLQLLMSAQLEGAQVDEADILDRMATVVAELQHKVGDRFGQQGYLPTSSELGFDMTKSIFEVGVAQRIEALSAALLDSDPAALHDLLQIQAEVFVGLAESLDLPGFADIAHRILEALSEHPEKILEIAPVALENVKAAQAQVLAGDRTQGGTPSEALKQYCSSKLAPAQTRSLSTQKPTFTDSARTQSPTRWFKRPFSWFRRHPSVPKISSDRTLKPSVSEPSISVASQASSRPLSDPSDSLGSQLSNVSAHGTAESTHDELLELITADSREDAGVELADLTIEDLVPAGLGAFNMAPETNQETLEAADPLLFATPDGAELKAPPGPSGVQSEIAQAETTVRIEISRLAQLNQMVGELLTQQNQQSLYNEELLALVKKLMKRIAKQQQQLSWVKNQSVLSRRLPLVSTNDLPQRPDPLLSSPADLTTYFDTLELDRYSDVQMLAQSCLEETVQQSESAEAIELFAQKSGQTLEKQKRLLSNTRELLLEARMVPLSQVFKRFPQAMKRLEAQHGKTVNLQLEGTELLVDKAIADQLYEPLLHLLRNAFDHGIESAQERLAHPKSATGRIILSGRQEGRHLVITVKDDGRGLDLARIRRKAIENRLITTIEANQLTEAQLVDLLFEVGFSTARGVDFLSGRGVGLDAVRARVRSLKGWVSVEHEPGAGTCFTLRIPSSLSIAKLLLFQARSRTYALIADAVEHVLIPAPAQVRSWKGGKMLTWVADDQEHLVPVNALSEILRYSAATPAPIAPQSLRQRSPRRQGARRARGDENAPMQPVILLRYDGALVGLEVDHLMGEQEMVINPLGTTIVPPPYLYGSSLLPDGQLTLVLDGFVLAKLAIEQNSRRGLNTEDTGSQPATELEPQPVFMKRLVLTVDDSITVRNAIADVLTRANYQVIQARDGEEALQQLKRYPNVQAILCDLEMIGMNGFEFLKARQQIPEIAAIPTVMLTSRAGEKHRLLTEELGANAYLTKPYLTPQLLQTVAEAIESRAELAPSLPDGVHR